MKTPISYYGGKQNLANIIVPLLPQHRLYCEPFTGGAAIFFAKKPSPVEVLNDLNAELVNFYEMLKTNFDALQGEVAVSLHSRRKHQQARVVYDNPDMFDRIKRAWAVWFLASTSFGSMLDGTFGSDMRGTRQRSLKFKRINFTKSLSDRLKNTRIEGYDAVKVIKDNDTADSCFYVDPPYVGADQGHYAGYTQSNFNDLLETLADIKGNFLLSSYPNATLSDFVKKYRWYQFELIMNNSMSASCIGHKVEKVEVLTANYPIAKYGLNPYLF
jgi:DNA adenine methylase